MKFPSPSDFLDALGIEPLEEDMREGYFRYLIASSEGRQVFDLSFRVVAESFQVVLRQDGIEAVRLSSEMARSLVIRRGLRGTSLCAEFDLQGCIAAAELTFEPHLNCH